MQSLFVIVFIISLIALLYFSLRFTILMLRKQDTTSYKKKLIASSVVLAVSLVVIGTIPKSSEQLVAKREKFGIEAPKEDGTVYEQRYDKERISEPKIDKQKELTPEEKAAKEAERQAKQKEFEEKQRQEQSERQIKEITTGWNLATTDTDNDKSNPQKAAMLVKKYPDYIHNAEANWISAEDALKKPWEYYGKVVNLSGRIYSIEQLPPNSSDAKFFGGSCYHAMLAVGDGYDPIAISIHIVGDSSYVSEDSIVNVKGYIFGHAQLVNRMGGGSRGLAFIGFQE